LHRWLRFRYIKGKTESTKDAHQDERISENYFKDKILKEEIGSKSRLCKQHEESTDHLTSGWPILAKNEYLMWCDRAGAHLHYSIYKALGIEKSDARDTHAHTNAQTNTHTHTNHYVNMEMGDCYGVKRQTLQPIGQIY
jgi:hypothetical protein